MAFRFSGRAGRTVLFIAVVVTACNPDRVIYDDWGVAGYARLQGTVSHADGSRFGNISVVYSCGDPEPTWFGGGIATTNAQGLFEFLVNAPGLITLPPSGRLVCVISAFGSDSAVASARATTAFSQNAATRPTTTFTLVEGQRVP
jgi:hypothetical protein